MSMVNLQVPMDKRTRDKATKVAKEQGFSSLQEVFRVFAKKYSEKEVAVSFDDAPVVELSAKAEARYMKMDMDFEKGRDVKSFESVEALMEDLRE